MKFLRVHEEIDVRPSPTSFKDNPTTPNPTPAYDDWITRNQMLP